MKESFESVCEFLVKFCCLAFAMVLFLIISGCAGSVVTKETLDAAGNVIERTITPIADSSVAKEQAVHGSLQARDKYYATAYVHSGFRTSYEMVNIGGVQAWLPKEVSFRESPNFPGTLPTEPSKHPGWKFAEKAVEVTADAAVSIVGIKALADFATSAVDASGTDYGSNNTFGEGSLGGNYSPTITEIPSVE